MRACPDFKCYFWFLKESFFVIYIFGPANFWVKGQKLVLVIDLLGGDKRSMEELGSVEVGFGEAVRSDLVVVVTSVIERASVEVVTVGKDGDFVFVVAEVGAAALLVDGVENVEELADARDFIVGREGI